MHLLKIFIVSIFLFPNNSHAEGFAVEEPFDALPISQSEQKAVTQLFWNAKSIQEKVKSQLPNHQRGQFSYSAGGQYGCDVKGVSKTEGSADVCELADDSEKQPEFVYNFNLSCNFGNYQVSVCSHEQKKLLNQVRVQSPEKLVQELPDDSEFSSSM
ncbi:MAG: hypothetical protein KDD33_09105 [Bdellovibrionales bacterium]|nr:hypothetical protein [Bdellovibrionales bacterium]